jgi:hypothetical protein
VSEVHVVPLRDLITHEVPGGLDGHANDPGRWLSIEAAIGPDGTGEPACPCGPSLENIPNRHGPDGWVVTHASLDGREKAEA